MGSDRARVSYDAKQQYRAVIAQQGRVTLEADWNEAQQLVDETIREETLDVIGSSGTPDDGYRVLPSTPSQNPSGLFDFAIQKGTLYVGGIRIDLPETILYSQQPDWQDHIGDPVWVEPPNVAPAPQREFIYLLLREQEVSAVEDSALREVALGGPDTAQRSRLLQHIIRRATEVSDCDTALEQSIRYWTGKGLQWNQADLRLESSATLKVTPFTTTTTDPCDPDARGGYLGAENQLIRVQITEKNAQGELQLVWGFDNASFLYQVKEIHNNVRLKLQPPPVDDFHRPRAGQVVEVLRSAARLNNGEYVASATGEFFTLAAPYNPDTQEITLPAALPTDPYQNSNQTPRLFVRIWEKQQTFTPDQALLLEQTGIQVTLQTTGGNPFHIGDYWLIAVRPSTPTQVYPQRYLDGPQPPNGPRLWLCPLAVITWQDDKLTYLDDCRNPFDSLVELTKRRGTGCCTILVRPEDVKADRSLQSIVDRFKNRERVTICLMPGNYSLPAPLILGPEHSNLTIEGCHDGAVLQAAANAENNFLHGLVILNHANNVTLRRLRFHLPQVQFIQAGGQIAGLKASLTSQLIGPRLQDLRVSIGIRPLHCAVLTIEDCLFRYSLTQGADVFGVGIFAGSECWGLTIRNCRFLHEEDYLHNLQEPLRMLIGYLLAPTISLRSLPSNSEFSQRLAGSLLRSLLQNAVLQDNQFFGLTLATMIMADIGTVSIQNNTVRDCYSGFWLLTLRSLFIRAADQQAVVNQETVDSGVLIAGTVLQLIREPITYLASNLAQSYPLPPGFDPRGAIQVPKPATRQLQDYQPLLSLMNQARVELLPDTDLTNALFNITRINLANLATSETVGFIQRLGDRLEALKQIALQQSERQPLQLSLDFSSNTVDTSIKNAPSGLALFVWDTDQQTRSMLTMGANCLRNNGSNPDPTRGNPTEISLPTTVLLQVDRCTVTGNLILNESVFSFDPTKESRTPIFFSLILLPGQPESDLQFLLNSKDVLRSTSSKDVLRSTSAIAVTGNVLKGLPCVPSRSTAFTDPLNSWYTFNTLII